MNVDPERPSWRRLLLGGGLLSAVVVLGLLASSPALGGKQRALPKLSARAVRVQPGKAPRQSDTCSANCSFPEGDIGLILSVSDSPCDGGYTFDVDPGDGSGRINGIPITGSCDTSQNPSVFTGSGQTDHVYTDESTGAYTVTFYWHDPDVGVIPGSLSLTITEGDSLTGKGINVGVKLHKAFSGPVATFTDTPANGFTAPASDMFPTVDWGDGSAPGSTLDGTVSVSDNGDGTFTVSGKHVYQDGPGPWLITIKLEDDQPGTASATTHAKASVREFTATPTDKVQAGSAIAYQGSGFDASGTSIVVGWDDLVDPLQQTTLSPALSFSGTQTAVFGHPIGDYDTACTAKLTATQDGATDTIPITGIKKGVVLAERNFARVVNGQVVLVQPPDFVCQGEQFASRYPSDVIFDDAGSGVLFSAAGYEAVFNISDSGDFTVPVAATTDYGHVSTPVRMARGATLCLPLGSLGLGGQPAPGPRANYGSVTIPQSPKGPYQAGQIGSGCLSSAPHGTGLDVVGGFCDQPGVSHIPSGTHTGDLTISGPTCLAGEGTRSLTVLGDLRLADANAILYVTGNLAVTGSVTGVGGLIVNGGTGIAGSLRVVPSGNDVIIAGGDVAVGG